MQLFQVMQSGCKMLPNPNVFILSSCSPLLHPLNVGVHHCAVCGSLKGKDKYCSGLIPLPQTSCMILAESLYFGRRCDGRALAEVQRSQLLVRVGCRGLANGEAPMPWLSHASSHLMLLKCFCGTLTLLSGMKYHSSCDYSHQGTQIPLRRGCLEMNLAVIVAKTTVVCEYRGNKQKTGSSKDAVPKIPWGSCRQLGSPSMPAKTMDVHDVMVPLTHNTTSSLPTTPLLAFPELSHTRVKKPYPCLYPPPLPSPFVPQNNLCLLAQMF